MELFGRDFLDWGLCELQSSGHLDLTDILRKLKLRTGWNKNVGHLWLTGFKNSTHVHRVQTRAHAWRVNDSINYFIIRPWHEKVPASECLRPKFGIVFVLREVEYGIILPHKFGMRWFYCNSNLGYNDFTMKTWVMRFKIRIRWILLVQ